MRRRLLGVWVLCVGVVGGVSCGANHAPLPLAFEEEEPDEGTTIEEGEGDRNQREGEEEASEEEVPEELSELELVALDRRVVDAYDDWRVEFDVDADVQSVTLIAEANPSSSAIYVWRIWSPSGELLYDMEEDYSVLSLTPFTTGGQMGVLLPNSPVQPLQVGRYNVDLWAERAAEVKVNLLYKRGGPRPPGGRLTVNLWFSDQEVLDPAGARMDPDFQDALAVVEEIFEAVNVDVVISGYYDIGGSLGRSLAVPRDDEQACAQIRELPRVHDGPAVNLVMIDHDNFTWGPILGLSCGIPGAPLYSEVSASGVMVALDSLRVNPSVFGDTIAHEIGHYLGLYHTSEADGLGHDPLPDTPECDQARDTDGDGVVSPEECRYHGGGNNMFWMGFFDGSQQLILTPDQSFVVTNNPVVESF